MKRKRGVPFRLVLSENLALGVVANYLDVDEAAKVESFGSEHRHLCGLQRGASCGYQVESRKLGMRWFEIAGLTTVTLSDLKRGCTDLIQGINLFNTRKLSL